MTRAATEIRHEIADSLRPGEIVDTGGVKAEVVSTHGTDPAAPVIVEELAPVGSGWLAGQLAIVSRRHVERIEPITKIMNLWNSARGKRP